MSGKYKYHLSLKNGRGIARISGGSLNNQILCITNENEPNISGKGSEDNSTNFFNKSNDEIIKLLGQDFINKLLAGKKKRKLGHNDMSEFIEFIREKYGKSNEIKSSDVDSDSDSCSDVDSNSENSFCNGKISIINYKKSKKGTSDNKEKKSSSNGKGKVTKTSMDKAYDIAVNKLKNDEGRIFNIDDDGLMIPIPNIEVRESLYIAGPSGAGKSTYSSKYIKEYQKLFPENNVYLFSRKKEDPVLDKLGIIRVDVNDELLKDPISLEDLKDSLTIFDDVDVLEGKFKKYIFELRDTILEAGRAQNTYIICTAHQLLNYKQSRTMLSEAHGITVFPSTGGDYHIRRWLKVYVGLDKNEIETVMKIPSRWITIYTHHPRYILYEHGCRML